VLVPLGPERRCPIGEVSLYILKHCSTRMVEQNVTKYDGAQ